MADSTEFFEAFNGTLPEAEAMFTEDWKIDGVTWPAIAINKMAVGSKVMRGGKFIEVNTEIFVREDVFQSSGVTKGAIINARGQDIAVIEIDTDGDASRTLVCGPSQIDVF